MVHACVASAVVASPLIAQKTGQARSGSIGEFVLDRDR